jgi:hypothetical protein
MNAASMRMLYFIKILDPANPTDKINAQRIFQQAGLGIRIRIRSWLDSVRIHTRMKSWIQLWNRMKVKIQELLRL